VKASRGKENIGEKLVLKVPTENQTRRIGAAKRHRIARGSLLKGSPAAAIALGGEKKKAMESDSRGE